jgi:hypothetical protein
VSFVIPDERWWIDFGDKFSVRRSALIFAPKRAKTRQTFLCDHEVGAIMSVLEILILAMILVWAPGLMLSAYLTFGPRRSID